MYRRDVYFEIRSPYLWEHVHETVPLIQAVLFIAVMSNLFFAAFTDPGIVPRATDEEGAFYRREEGQYVCWLCPQRILAWLVPNVIFVVNSSKFASKHFTLDCCTAEFKRLHELMGRKTTTIEVKIKRYIFAINLRNS